MNNRQNASIIKTSRKIHRVIAAGLFILFLLIPVTGIILGWKKNTGDIILPRSYEGSTTNTAEWLSYDTLEMVACKALLDYAGKNISTDLDRIDARPSKGMVKFIFTDHYWEVQLDAATAEILNISKRRSDIIENIHDGSILDKIFRTEEGVFKILYTSLVGLSLLALAITGFWLWYGPKLMKMNKRNDNSRNKLRH
ncbi:MAG: PepSY domain-containing protein [Bacteroidales bacterium]|nr:PepSY domain-containing protein [Bacteroidales bacterium]